MILKKIPSWAVVLVFLVCILALALWLRIALPFNQVFVHDWVKLTGVDTYYYMRLVDNIVHHFPALTEFDPYFVFPEGRATGLQPDFFAYTMAAVVCLFGLGSPDQHMIDVIAVYIPPLMAAVTVVIVFFLGRALVNKWVGLLAALMLAIMPGEFLNRSLLGYTDHHIAEVMWSSLAMLLYLLALKQAEGLGPACIREKGWKCLIRPGITAVLGGLVLGIYALTWLGAPLFILIIFVYMAIQIILDHLAGRSPVVTASVGATVLFVSLIVYLPQSRSLFTPASILGGLALTVVFVAISLFMSSKNLKRPLYIAAIGIVILLIVGLMYLLLPGLFLTFFSQLLAVFAWKPETTIMEVQPLLLDRGVFTLGVILGNYTSGLLLGLGGLILLTWQVCTRREKPKVLLLVWSIIILFAALAMRRAAYYFAVNIALLTGIFAWWLLELAGFGKEQAMAREVKKSAPLRTKAAKKRAAAQVRKDRGRLVWMSVVLPLILFVMVYPNLGPWPQGGRPAIDVATQPLFAPPNAWCESMDWLRENTPEPLGNADAYYGQFKLPGEPGGYVYPRDAYGVLAWWDYGYWITRIGRRIPFSNPGTSAERGEYKFFLAQDEASAADLTKDISIRYVIVDSELASCEGKFHALPTWNGETYQKYYEICIQKQGDKYVPSILFHPEYYRSMVIRLYNFEGKEVVPAAVDVIEYRMVTMDNGQKLKELIDNKKFKSYEEAVEFVKNNKGKNYEIGGMDPYVSPVPLEALKHFKLVYGSKDKTAPSDGSHSLVKIFEYTL